MIYALTSDGFTYRELRDQAEFIRAELLRVTTSARWISSACRTKSSTSTCRCGRWRGWASTPDLLAATLASQNAVIASGTIETPSERIAVRVSGALDSVAALENVAIRVGDRQVRLRDFARVTRGYKDPPTPQYRYNGEPAIGIGVSMSKGGNVLDLGVALEKELTRIESDLPVGIDVHRVANQPEVVEESVGQFTRGLFEAIGIVLIVSFVSLGVRAGLVVAVSIPLVLAITFVFMEIFEISLQRISLGALIISLGLLVDDAMIAVEMMVKKMEEGWDKFRAATFAYTSTAFPMLTGTLVSVAGFLPVGFAKSGAGEYCFTLFAVVTIALLVSWVVAVIFTPYIGVAVLKEQPAGHVHVPTDTPMTARFRRVLMKSLANRGWVVAGTAGAFVARDGAVRLRAAAVLPVLEPARAHDRPAPRAERVHPGHRDRSAAFREGPAGRPGRRLPQLLRGLGRRAFLSAAQPAARERQLRAGGGDHEELRGARCGACAAGEGARGGFRHADGARRAAGARTARGLAAAVSRERAGRRGRARHGRRPWPPRCARTPIRASSISTGTK